MEDHRLKSFCLVVETKSFSRAAQAKHMTQSAMSRLVKSLEDELGVILLHRKGKAALPTAEGRLFYDHAKKILEDYAKLAQDIGSATRTAKGVLRLGASRTPSVHLLPQALYDFSKAHPEIRIELSVCKTSNIVRDLHEGKLDAGIVEGAISDRALRADAVAGDEIVIIAPEDHPLTKKKTVMAMDLAGEYFILPDQGSGTREMVDDFFRDAGLDARRIRVRMVLGSPELIVRMVQTGLGVGFASKWSVFAAVKEGTVKILHMQGKKMKRHFYLIHLEHEQPGTVKTFREFIQEYKFLAPF
jgi:DNA-binding transcriptional LysR family regulator